MPKTKLTTDDLFNLRDACVHAIRANSANPDLYARYEALDKKLQQMLREGKA